MKLKQITAIALLITASATARIIVPFGGWSQVEGQSSCIVIAHCGEPTPPTPGEIVINATKSDSAINVISVLRGTNGVGPSRLLTDYDLKKGENYLIFGNYDGTAYNAYEEYRIVPLGNNFRTNSISGKPLDEQLRILFQRRLDSLSRQMQKEQEEKQRLEAGLMK